MKLTLISDTHNRMESAAPLPSADVLIHAGDLTMGGSEKETKKALHWLREVSLAKFKHVILIAGNHDFYFEDAMRKGEEAGLKVELKEFGNFTYLRDDNLIIDGVRFYGSPWQPYFGGWAFNVLRGSELEKMWRNIPLNTDILITHGPPKGVLDVSGEKYGSESVGDQELKMAVQLIEPKLRVFGHIHNGYGIHFNSSDRRLSVNASQADEDYNPVNHPIVVELDAR